MPDPELIDYPIPGNDDALRSINFYAEIFKTTIIEAKKNIAISKEQTNQDLPKESKNKKK